MLIRGLRARNFMKFQRLEIEEIPVSGLIGIEGANEGGKSTIGELVQFALFGKTVSSQASALKNLINWECDECSVELDFDVMQGPEAGSYRVYRQLDRYDTNYARVIRRDNGAELASGLMRVDEVLYRLFRFTYDDFIRSFFLAEREFPRSPEEMRRFLDRMVGAEVLLDVRRDVEREINGFEEDFARLQAEIRRHEQQIEKYLPNIEKIPEVEATLDSFDAKIGEGEAAIQALEKELSDIDGLVQVRDRQRDLLKQIPDRPAAKLSAAAQRLLEAYPTKADPALKSSRKDIDRLRGRMQELGRVGEQFDELHRQVDIAKQQLAEKLDAKQQGSHGARETSARDRLRQAEGRRSRALMTGHLMFVLALISGAFGLNARQGWIDVASKMSVPADRLMLIAFIASGMTSLLAILLWLRGASHGGTVREANDELDDIGRERSSDKRRLEKLKGIGVETKLADVAAAVTGVGLAAVEEAATKYDDALRQFVADQSLAEVVDGFAGDESRIVQRLRSAAKGIKKDVQKHEDVLKKDRSKRDRADTEVREYRKQEDRKATLEEQNAEIQSRADAVRVEMDTRHLLTGMIDEAVQSIRHRAGPSLGKTMRRLLPAVTGGRYRDLKITPEFKLQVFTSDKSDFLEQHELSGGTFEGLSLGFRLAFTQSFIRAVVHGPQFLFLDEPFKAMDAERVHRMLQAMMRLSPELQQVFVIIPGIKDEDRELFDHIYSVAVGLDDLTADSRGQTLKCSSEVDVESLPTAPARSASEPMASSMDGGRNGAADVSRVEGEPTVGENEPDIAERSAPLAPMSTTPAEPTGDEPLLEEPPTRSESDWDITPRQ